MSVYVCFLHELSGPSFFQVHFWFVGHSVFPSCFIIERILRTEAHFMSPRFQLIFSHLLHVRVSRFYQSWPTSASASASTATCAGLQPRAPELSGHCRTSTASSRSELALELQISDQWALPDLNRECQRPCRTSTASASAQPQLREPDLSGQCQVTPQKRNPVECQIECQKNVSERMPDGMSECMPERAPEKTTEYMSDRLPDMIPDEMPDRMA